MAKRKCEWDVLDIEESDNATIHGVVTKMSPVKVSKYFNGTLSDGRKSVRLVLFDPTLLLTLVSAFSEGSSVSLVNCLVKPK